MWGWEKHKGAASVTGQGGNVRAGSFPDWSHQCSNGCLWGVGCSTQDSLKPVRLRVVRRRWVESSFWGAELWGVLRLGPAEMS